MEMRCDEMRHDTRRHTAQGIVEQAGTGTGTWTWCDVDDNNDDGDGDNDPDDRSHQSRDSIVKKENFYTTKRKNITNGVQMGKVK